MWLEKADARIDDGDAVESAVVPEDFGDSQDTAAVEQANLNDRRVKSSVSRSLNVGSGTVMSSLLI